VRRSQREAWLLSVTGNTNTSNPLKLRRHLSQQIEKEKRIKNKMSSREGRTVAFVFRHGGRTKKKKAAMRFKKPCQVAHRRTNREVGGQEEGFKARFEGPDNGGREAYQKIVKKKTQSTMGGKSVRDAQLR